MMRVAITGVSSYSGACIARAFAQAGYRTTGILSASRTSYGGRKRLRLESLEEFGVTLAAELPAQGGKMSAWLRRQKFELWVHHHHPMEQFRSQDYDVAAASKVALDPLLDLASAWTDAHVSAVLYSGTYFEPGEGGQSAQASGTPYARLKAQVAERLFELAEERGISRGKIVIPSPIGALENEDRLTPQLLLAALRGEPFLIRSPNSVFDNIPGEALATVYVEAAAKLLSSEEPTERIDRPSGSVVTAAEWAAWVDEHIAQRLGKKLLFRVPEPSERPAATSFQNPESERIAVDWRAVGAAYAQDFHHYYPFL
jgi:UDP-glucose 4-epimerase